VNGRNSDLGREAARLLRWTTGLSALLFLLCVTLGLGGAAVATAETPASPTRVLYGTGEIVPIPASIPHEDGDMVDRRIIPDLRWLAANYPIYVTDGYSGPLPGGERAGCDGCHITRSDHHYGLAVDIVPLEPSSRCDGKWAAVTRLARWAEPRQNRPVAPFRWVGYDGDSGHGCGHHLHLSWNHAPAPEFEVAEWVEVLPALLTATARTKRAVKPPPPPAGAGVPSGSGGPSAASGPSGGVSQIRSGGLAPRGSGD
jgi:hypothetical protein